MPGINLKSGLGGRLTALLLLLTGLAALAGCQRLTLDQQMQVAMERGKPPPTFMTASEIEALDRRTYIRDLRLGLARDAFNANHEALQGDVTLHMKLNRQGDVLLCEAQTKGEEASSRLANLVTDVCWSRTWKAVPKSLQSPTDGSLEIAAPLVFTGNPATLSEYELKNRRDAAASRFFWDNVVARHSIDAVGFVTFGYTANATGQVIQCDVKLKSDDRPANVLPNPELKNILANECLQLNVQQMFGFNAGEDGLSRKLAFVGYSPWKQNVGKYPNSTADLIKAAH